GTFAGNISIASDTPATPFLIPVSGQVLELPTPPAPAPLIAVSQGGNAVTSGQLTPVSFGSVVQNGTPLQLTFTVANNGNDPLTTSAFHLPGGFSSVEGLSASILPGQSDTFTVKMSSTAIVGDLAGSITFTSNSGGSDNTFTLPVIAHV